MRVLLIVPRYSSRWGAFYQFPLGLGYIASAIKSSGHDLRVVNLNHDPKSDELVIHEAITDFAPDVCATGGLSVFIPQVSRILRICRTASTHSTRVVGGGIVSGAPDEILDLVDADFGVVNEGEQTIQELLATLESNGDVSTVAGILYRDPAGSVRYTGERPTEYDLSKFSWPAYEDLEFEQNIVHQRALDNYFFHTQEDSRPRALDMITSRSCPFKCTFCFHPTGKTYRERPLDDFFAELDHVVEKFSPNMVALIDELFSLRRDRLLELCDRIKPYNLKWMVQLHVRSATFDVLTAMRDSGCTYISYGIESMSQEILTSMEKKSKVDQVDTALRLTRQVGIGIQGNLLFGDSAETVETANESMKWWASNRDLGVWLTPLHVFPGSPDHQEAVKIGLIGPDQRLTYVRDLPVDLNISKMNDVNLEMVRHLVYVYNSSLLRIAPHYSWLRSGQDSYRQANLYTIEWACGDCGHINVYQDVIVEEETSPSLRLTCRSCRSRWDIRNEIPMFATPNSIPMRSSLSNSRDPKEEFWRRASVALRDPRRALRFMRARFYSISRGIMSSISREGTSLGKMDLSPLERSESNRQLLFHLGSRLASFPFDSQLHIDFSVLLHRLKINGGARAHFEQALLLGAQEINYRELQMHLDSLEDDDPSRSVFFISWSSDPSPRELLMGSRPNQSGELLQLIVK